MPPKLIKLGDVPAHLTEHYEINVTRQTVYNWAKAGKRGTVLRTTLKAGNLYTTGIWINDFVTSVPS